ncbi:methyl-accepting chemotaxis protein [Brevibacillus ginsengisoli]|uniref:methyl-accepting chemotaxis protein n=1 Tax=Brevibacillus ginsengisoli TaxID=363854 RepID=UPI003CE814FE
MFAWMNNMRIKTRLWILVGLLLAIMGAIGYIGYHYLDEANGKMKAMYANNLFRIQLLGKTQVNLLAYEGGLYRLIIEDDPKRMQQILKEEMDPCIQENDQLLHTYQSSSLEPFEQGKMSILNQLLAGYRAERNEVVKYSLKNDTAESLQAYNKIRPILTQINQIINDLVIFQETQAEDHYNQSRAEESSAIAFLTTSIILAALLAILLAYFAIRSITKPINELIRTSQQVAEGDLTHLSGIRSTNEIGQLGRAINEMIVKLRTLIAQIVNMSQQTASSTIELASSAQQSGATSNLITVTINEIAEGATKQADHTNTVFHQVENMLRDISGGFELAKTTFSKVKRTVHVTHTGNESILEATEHLHQVAGNVRSSTDAIRKLGQRSAEIGSITSVITDIANQTNLLALNAAIEAARAGEHGKGFAVVADEVRKLAEESKVAGTQISELINSVLSETQLTISTMENNLMAIQEQEGLLDKSSTAFRDIVEHVRETEQSTSQVNLLFKDIQTGAESILRAVQEITEITQRAAASTQEIAASTEQQSAAIEEISANISALSQLADEMNQEVHFFQVN